LSAVMTSLRNDHINIALLIDLAQDALSDIEANEATDLELFEDVMKYATGYPDTHHHPTEDVVFEALRAKVPSMRRKIDAAVAEHVEIIDKGQALLDLLRSIEGEAFVERKRLLAVGHDYLARLKRHMQTEESELFPAALEHLNVNDWRAIEERTAQEVDPLFGPTIDREFERLWKRIELHKPQ
jgi:hemerythrin-like domain-containing protein